MNFPTLHNPCSTTLLFHVGISGTFKKESGVQLVLVLTCSFVWRADLELSFDSQRFSAILCQVPPSQVVKSHQSRPRARPPLPSTRADGVECYGNVSTWGGGRSYRKLKGETGQNNSWLCTSPNVSHSSFCFLVMAIFHTL